MLSLRAGDVVVNEIMDHPPTHRAGDAWIELHNRGPKAVNLANWRLTAGVSFTLPPYLLPAGGFVVVAADSAAFAAQHPSVTTVIGGWQGRLNYSGEAITLRDALGAVQDSVEYATEGDWAVRQRGLDDHGHRGWIWYAAHDGFGPSAERVNAALATDSGQNWLPSQAPGGTPGAVNSVAAANIAPLILDVQHAPAVPTSGQPVVVTARVLDDLARISAVSLHYRAGEAPEFAPVPMFDDGNHGDGQAGDGEFGARLPPQPQDTVVEFFVEARDDAGLARTWPAAVQPEGTQSANCLYQVDDRPYAAAQPLYRVVMSPAEQAELAQIDAMLWHWSSDAEMNGTFISTEAGQTEVRYTIGFRLRGTTSRAEPVKSRRVNFNTDRRWHGQRAINLNAVNPHSQVIGSVLCRRAGLPVARARAVQLRENNQQRAPVATAPFGVYAELEVLNGDFADRQFPLDSAGNLYQAIGKGNLDYLDDPGLYRSPEYYEKHTNEAEDDWRDLIEVTSVLNRTAPDQWFSELGRVADIAEWVRYFAVNTVVANTETGLGTGGAGDYAFYIGMRDPRLRLVIHDLDSILGVSGGTDWPVLRATNNPAIHRFLTAPEVAPLYFADLERVMDRDLPPAVVSDLLHQFLGDWVPADTLQAMEAAYRTRLQFIRSQLPRGLTADANLSRVEGVLVTSNATVTLTGRADVTTTRAVRVSGQAATWNPLTGEWSAVEVPLFPGVNRLLVQCLGAAGEVVAEQAERVWYRSEHYTVVGGTLSEDTTWSPFQGPIIVLNDLTVPAGLTLNVEPGTTVFFWSTMRLRVQGRLIAEGTPERRIYLGREPGGAYAWGGIQFENSLGNRIRHVDIAYHADSALLLTNSAVLGEHITFIGSFGNVIWGHSSSMVFRHCEFPDLPYGEHVRGDHLPLDGEWIFENNVFGSTTDYSDIMDVSGGQRPGPVLQVLNNVFKGGSDDGLDLDGAAAHIEGNVFMHFHKSNTSTSEASAISTGEYEGRGSDLVLVRNVFFDNDQDVILKEGSTVQAAHNTFIGAKTASFLVNEPQRPWEAPPAGALVEDSLFWGMPDVVGNLDPALLTNGVVQLSFARSLVPATGPWAAADSFIADPRLVNPTNDFHLRPGSPASGAAAGGRDLGAYVPAGVAVAGEPPPVTWRRDATLRVTGPGYTHFRWRLDAGPWSDPLPIGKQVPLTNLSESQHQFFAVGLNSAGVWQAEAQATASRPWAVVPASAGVRLSEVLAWNTRAWPHAGGYPDFVELHNDSPVPADLGGLALTDDPLEPRKFVFPQGTSLDPDGYLVVSLVPGALAGGLTAGFGLDRDGGTLQLLDRPGGRGVLASVTFGPQVADLSIGDRGDGTWTLTVPTPGAANRAQRLGDPAGLRISEWLARSGPSWPSDFVELQNQDDLPVSLEGLALSTEPVGNPLEYPLPPLSYLAAHGYAVFLADANQPARANHLPFRLSAEQGTIALVTAAGAWQDWITYGPQREGISQGRPVGGSSSIVTLPVPTPGTGLAVEPGSGAAVLSEVLAHNVTLTNAAGAASDWIEIANRGTNWVSLAGLSLSDRLEDPRRWVFPAGSTLAPGGFVVVECEPALPASATNTGFGLSADGESVHLFDPEGQLLDTITFGPQAADFSVARLPTAPAVWVLARPTPGAVNEAVNLGDPAALRVNEWMADSSSGPDWLELFNSGTEPVALADLQLSDAPDNPDKYAFPPLSFVAGGAHGYLRLFADEDSSQGPAHLPFKLSAKGEAIVLSLPGGGVLDQVEFGAQKPDLSQGRLPDGSASLRELTAGGSPGGPNSLNTWPVVAAIPDQQVEVGRPWSYPCLATDLDLGQAVHFGLVPPHPAGLTIEPATGVLSWTPGFEESGLTYHVTVVATDEGAPAASGYREFVLAVANYDPPLAWESPWRDAAGNVHLAWAARPGGRYAVDATADLGAVQWVNLAEVQAAGLSAEVVLPAAEGGQRFFRLRRLAQ